MKTKVKYLVTTVLILFLSLIIGMSLIYNNESNLVTHMAAISTTTKEGIPAVVISFQYKWSKMPVRISSDTLKFEWSRGWKLYDFSIKINENEEKSKFYYPNNSSTNKLELTLNSNSNYLSSEYCDGKIILIPEDKEYITSHYMSEANLQYMHKKFLGNIIKAESTGWDNKLTSMKNN